MGMHNLIRYTALSTVSPSSSGTTFHERHKRIPGPNDYASTADVTLIPFSPVRMSCWSDLA